MSSKRNVPQKVKEGHTSGEEDRGKDTFAKSLLSTNGGNGNSLPSAFRWGSPILNCEAPEPHHCGSWKVSTPSCIRPGRCISSYQQVHQKQVFGNKRRNTHREMWLHLSNEHLPQTLVLYKIKDGKKRFRRPGSQCAQCREAQWAQVVTTVQNRGPHTGGSAQVQG